MFFIDKRIVIFAYWIANVQDAGECAVYGRRFHIYKDRKQHQTKTGKWEFYVRI